MICRPLSRLKSSESGFKAEGGVVVSACFRLTPWGFFLEAAAEAGPAAEGVLFVADAAGVVVAGVLGTGVGVDGSTSEVIGSPVLEVTEVERTDERAGGFLAEFPLAFALGGCNENDLICY